jgi:hypothetical protein
MERNSKTPVEIQTRRFGSEGDVSAITGFSPRTLQKDRLLNRNRFPFYKVGAKVLYDLDEVQRIVLSNRQGDNVAA